ncbi:hypothetical protein Tco_1040361 [Tanacetum coccineum]
MMGLFGFAEISCYNASYTFSCVLSVQAEMTVNETLDFLARCQGVGSRYELDRREKDAGIFPEPEVDLFMKDDQLGAFENALADGYTIENREWIIEDAYEMMHMNGLLHSL